MKIIIFPSSSLIFSINSFFKSNKLTSICPEINLVKAIKSLSDNQCLKHNETLIAYRSKESIPSDVINYEGDFMQVSQLWHIFEYNDDCIKSDFKLLTQGRTSKLISETNAYTNPENIFIEDGAKVEHAILNASTGPIYG